MTAIPSTSLPIDTVLSDLCTALERYNRGLLVAQPGAGKTTRVPLMLLEQTAPENGRWLLLEPRRVAARLAAAWMAEQLGEPLGKTVGYRVRGEQQTSRQTRLEVVTQGILIRMIQADPTLEGITGIIFDEFHERSLDADLGLALVLDVHSSLRNDLKLLIMSATLDTRALLDIMGSATPTIECPGRSWPVITHYRARHTQETTEQHRTRVILEALSGHDGNLLVFLPGQAEIYRLQRTLESRLGSDIDIQPLHGQLTLARQQEVLRRHPNRLRRVILSTDIAESSLTVPDVRVVVDAGQERVPVFQPRSGLTRLETRKANRASADQRRGRAGRQAEGHCYRLWAQEQPLMAHREPEILQADLSGLAFELAQWGVTDADQLIWVTPPPAAALASGRKLLQSLGILDDSYRLTAFGRRCAHWATHPRLASLLEAAARLDALPLACWLVAWLEESPHSDDVDMATLLMRRPRREEASSEGRWWRAARQWARKAGCKNEPVNLDHLPTLLLHAFPDRIARQSSPGRFKLVSGGQALLPISHPLAQAQWLVAVELDGQTSGARIFHAAKIDVEDVRTLFPDVQQWHERITWNDETGRLAGEEVQTLGQLILDRRPLRQLPAGAARKALLEAVQRRGHLKWSDSDRQLLGRLRLVRSILGAPWPLVNEEQLLDSLEDWLAPELDGIASLGDLDRLPLGKHLLNSLDWSLRQQLDVLAPTHLPVPSGSRIAIDYQHGEPVLAAKIQELFGQTDTPRLVDGRVPVLIHLLSPARRPVQVTRDLASFWATTYFQVRKDLRGRYPKHPWPDDPLTAQATRHTRHRSR